MFPAFRINAYHSVCWRTDKHAHSSEPSLLAYGIKVFFPHCTSHVLGTYRNRLSIKAIPTNIHNICFHREIRSTYTVEPPLTVTFPQLSFWYPSAQICYILTSIMVISLKQPVLCFIQPFVLKTLKNFFQLPPYKSTEIQIWPCPKKVKVQPLIIWWNFLKLETAMLYTKIQTQKFLGSKDFCFYHIQTLHWDFNDTSTLVGHFVSSPRKREKRDRDSRWKVTGKKEEQEWKWRNRAKIFPISLTCYKDSRPCPTVHQ